MPLKPTIAKAFFPYNVFVNSAPTDEFVNERLARQFAMKVLESATFTRVDTPEGAEVTVKAYIFSKQELDYLLKRYFDLGYTLANQELANFSTLQ